MFWSTHKYVLFFSPHYHDNDLIRLPLSRCCVTWVGAPRVQIFYASKGQVKLSSSRSEVESKQLDHKNFYVPRVPISIAKKYIFKEFSEGTVKQDLTPVPALICGHFPPPPSTELLNSFPLYEIWVWKWYHNLIFILFRFVHYYLYYSQILYISNIELLRRKIKWNWDCRLNISFEILPLFSTYFSSSWAAAFLLCNTWDMNHGGFRIYSIWVVQKN